MPKETGTKETIGFVVIIFMIDGILIGRESLPTPMESLHIVISFYLQSWFGQKTAKGPFGLRVKLPSAHLSTTHGKGFTLSLLMLNVKQESCEYQFL